MISVMWRMISPNTATSSGLPGDADDTFKLSPEGHRQIDAPLNSTLRLVLPDGQTVQPLPDDGKRSLMQLTPAGGVRAGKNSRRFHSMMLMSRWMDAFISLTMFCALFWVMCMAAALLYFSFTLFIARFVPYGKRSVKKPA